MLIPETYIITMAKITSLSNPLIHPSTSKTAELIIETIKRYPVNPSPIGLGDFTLPPPIIFWLEETYGLTHQQGYYPLTLSPNPNLKPTLIASPIIQPQNPLTQPLWPEETYDPNEWKNTTPIISLTPEHQIFKVIFELLIKTSTLNHQFIAIIIIKPNKIGKIPDEIHKNKNWSLILTIPSGRIPLVSADATYTTNTPPSRKPCHCNPTPIHIYKYSTRRKNLHKLLTIKTNTKLKVAHFLTANGGGRSIYLQPRTPKGKQISLAHHTLLDKRSIKITLGIMPKEMRELHILLHLMPNPKPPTCPGQLIPPVSHNRFKNLISRITKAGTTRSMIVTSDQPTAKWTKRALNALQALRVMQQEYPLASTFRCTPLAALRKLISLTILRPAARSKTKTANMTKHMLTIANATLKAAQIFQKNIANLTDKWFIKNKIAPNASTVLSFIYTHTVSFRPQGMQQTYTSTSQPGDPAHSNKTPICPKCLEEDDQPLLKCQKCDVCFKCLGLIPCTKPKSNDLKSKYKRTRSTCPTQTNTQSKRPKPSLLPLPLSATTHTADKVGTKAHKRKKYLKMLKRRRARAAKEHTRSQAKTNPRARRAAEAAAGAQPSAKTRAAILARIAATQKRAAAKNKRAYRPARVRE